MAWVDDSKATNPHAAAASLGAFGDVVWVVGGLLKGVDISELVAARAGRIRAAIVIGVDRAAVLAAFARHAPGVPVLEVTHDETEDVMARVVELARGAARPGDTVLLAPAAASFDQFESYSARGRLFAEAVHSMVNESGGADGDGRSYPE